MSLLLGDEQGSTSVMMPVHLDASGGMLAATLADAAGSTRTAYTPFGELRGADNTATDRGWLGQVEDRVDGASGTGLTYLNARYYDPATMRFISPDPLMNPGDPKTLDPYRYADNNPVILTDATGLWPDTGEVINPLGVWSDIYWDLNRGAWDTCVRAGAGMLLFAPGVPKSLVGDNAGIPGVHDPVDDAAWDMAYGIHNDGYLVQANRTFNPFYGMLESGSCTIDAVEAGDAYNAGACGMGFTLSTASLVGLAYGGAKGIAPKVAPKVAPTVKPTTTAEVTAPSTATPASPHAEYFVNPKGMAPHLNGTPGKSQFAFWLDARKAVLDAAKWADEHGAWSKEGKAKVEVTNGIVGFVEGAPTSFINVYRRASGALHGSPGRRPV